MRCDGYRIRKVGSDQKNLENIITSLSFIEPAILSLHEGSAGFCEGEVRSNTQEGDPSCYYLLYRDTDRGLLFGPTGVIAGLSHERYQSISQQGQVCVVKA